MKLTYALLATLIATGCAQTKIAENLPNNVVLSQPDTYGQRYIEQLRFDYAVPPESKDDLAKCLALNINNSGVTLADSSRSFVGASTGNYYNIDQSREVTAGETVRYLDAEKGEAVINGRTSARYTFGMVPIENIIEYKLSVDASTESAGFAFTDIKVAQKDTGVVANNGFDRAGAWESAKPMLLHDALQKVASSVAECMGATSSAANQP